ncbi:MULTISPECIES: hypothetical protein [Acinetobacter]|uniref:hypothetical protein n=1 Tax=Acinetobacter TaxID=469 RepID=UPI001436915D|nr:MULTISPECIES: hypothetical protein [Acinetobacter]MCA4815725.1 hypothetical protein [Acinetobacter towneri]QIV91409.1 hypothetical protein GVU25_00605 [Acinetobacter towneri]UNT64644.1 hypothetical protein IHE37_00555 [Acinetobacter towneri]
MKIKGIPRARYWQHWWISMLLLSFSTLIAIGLAIHFSVDRVFWPISLMVHLSINLIFSFVFSALQTYFKHTVWQSVVLINITAVLLIAIHAMFYLQTIDWNAVSEAQQQLSLLQQVIHSDMALWIVYMLPLLVVMLIAAIKKYRYS